MTTPGKVQDQPTGQSLADGILTLSNNLYATLHSLSLDTPKKYDNVIYSPFSLSSCFAMLKVGTRGATAQELQKGFNYPTNEDALCQGYQNILKSLTGVDSGGKKSQKSVEFKLISANRLYVDESFKIKKSYEQTLSQYYDGKKLARLKLDGTAAKEINGWVEDVTNGKIRNLVEPSDFQKDPPKLVLVNAVYFKAEWHWVLKFEKSRTKPQDFFLSDDPKDKISVLMMKNGGFGGSGIHLALTHLKEVDADVFVLPYENERFAMLVYLPKEKSGLKKIQGNIKNLPKISIILHAMTTNLYQLSLPKFHIESTLDLIPILNKMGVTGIFKPTGDFSGMVEPSEKEMMVSQAVQKAIIIVDEKGTEAAAATATSMGAGGGPVKEAPLLVVDHPFYFQVVDKYENLVLFAGSCSRPVLATKESLKAYKSKKHHGQGG